MISIYYSEQFQKKEHGSQESRRLLDRVLREYCGLSGQVTVRTEKQGRRYIDERSGIFFSVTHTDRFWFCSVYNQRHGIDAELWSRNLSSPRRLAARFLTEPEQRELSLRTDEEAYRKRLIWLWTRKEAYLKYTGEGLYGLGRAPSVLEAPGGLVLRTVDRDGVCFSVCAGKEAVLTDFEWIRLKE